MTKNYVKVIKTPVQISLKELKLIDDKLTVSFSPTYKFQYKNFEYICNNINEFICIVNKLSIDTITKENHLIIQSTDYDVHIEFKSVVEIYGINATDLSLGVCTEIEEILSIKRYISLTSNWKIVAFVLSATAFSLFHFLKDTIQITAVSKSSLSLISLIFIIITAVLVKDIDFVTITINHKRWGIIREIVTAVSFVASLMTIYAFFF